MAKSHTPVRKSSSGGRSIPRPTVLASCYTVDARSALLKGLHYSTTGAGGPLQGHSGIPEVGSGIPSPPRSAPLAATVSHHEHVCADESTPSFPGGAAYHIKEECERLFCEKLKVIFSGERKIARQEPLVMGTHNTSMTYRDSVSIWVEVWDYSCDLNFKGFVGGPAGGRSLFIFFKPDVVGKDLKPGLMALIELASQPSVACSDLIICVNRSIGTTNMDCIVRNLGWIGFELTTLAPWNDKEIYTSREWLMLAMEV